MFYISIGVVLVAFLGAALLIIIAGIFALVTIVTTPFELFLLGFVDICFTVLGGITLGLVELAIMRRNVDKTCKLEYELEAESDDPEIRDRARRILARGLQ